MGYHDPEARIQPIFGENYDIHYRTNWWTGNVILDIGADVGSTADYFLRKGAKKVLCVEGNTDYFKGIQSASTKIPEIIPLICKMIWTPGDIEEVLRLTLEKEKVDVVKMDCEKCEQHLPQVPNELIQQFPMWVIETHQMDFKDNIILKLRACGYEISDEYPYEGTKVLYARKKQQ